MHAHAKLAAAGGPALPCRYSPCMPMQNLLLQDDQLYHATVFHASSHLHPVLATPEDVDAEARAIASVASTSCPIEAVLERIILTSSGVASSQTP
eukprot:1156316-Pelagomonas_calceolata.AAC.3